MIETREQENRVQELAREYPHGVGVTDLTCARLPFGAGGASHQRPALLTCHDENSRPVHREIVLPDGTRFVEARDG